MEVVDREATGAAEGDHLLHLPALRVTEFGGCEQRTRQGQNERGEYGQCTAERLHHGFPGMHSLTLS